ncbi:rnf217 [Symbiodinium natans]|uniref:Rnf217 protein n=1 Tax=Symbiodinium natans TaxID=878477 RepID=A0A812PMU2_9DINO|nr:rnf217 [Symbiodinium natans]
MEVAFPLRRATPLRPVRIRCAARDFRPLGYGNGKHESTTFAGWSNCYLGSNDPYGETLHSILSVVRAKYLTIDRFVSVVGSLVALQFLLVLKPKVIHFFDMNPQQVLWAKMLCELIAVSNSPEEFISRVFARDVRSFERRLGGGSITGDRLTHLNQHRFLQLPVSRRLRRRALQRLSAKAQATYREVLMPLQDGEKPGWFTPALVPCEDRRRFGTLARTGLGPQGRLPGDRFASLLYGEGWLTNAGTFRTVKEKLRTTPITWATEVDFSGAGPEEIIPEDFQKTAVSAGAPRTLVFCMDMWSSHFARPWSRTACLDWRQDGRLVAVQSITATKAELVQELEGTGGSLAWRRTPNSFCRRTSAKSARFCMKAAGARRTYRSRRCSGLRSPACVGTSGRWSCPAHDLRWGALREVQTSDGLGAEEVSPTVVGEELDVVEEPTDKTSRAAIAWLRESVLVSVLIGTTGVTLRQIAAQPCGTSKWVDAQPIQSRRAPRGTHNAKHGTQHNNSVATGVDQTAEKRSLETLHTRPACVDTVVALLRLAGQGFGGAAAAVAVPVAIAAIRLACAGDQEEGISE